MAEFENMATVIKKKSDKKNLTRKFKKALALKGVDTHKYCGVIKLKRDPLIIQKELRDEWQ